MSSERQVIVLAPSQQAAYTWLNAHAARTRTWLQPRIVWAARQLRDVSIRPGDRIVYVPGLGVLHDLAAVLRELDYARVRGSLDTEGVR